MSVEITIICDECGRLVDAAPTAKKARAAIREAGGRVALPGGRDICNWCVAELNAADAAGAGRVWSTSFTVADIAREIGAKP